MLPRPKEVSLGSTVSSVTQIQGLVKSSVTNLVDYRNGYDMDNIFFKGNNNIGTWTLSNNTPSALVEGY